MRKKLFGIFSFLQKWIDSITTAVASVLIAIMFCVIIANVVLRAIPAVGGFRFVPDPSGRSFLFRHVPPFPFPVVEKSYVPP